MGILGAKIELYAAACVGIILAGYFFSGNVHNRQAEVLFRLLCTSVLLLTSHALYQIFPGAAFSRALLASCFLSYYAILFLFSRYITSFLPDVPGNALLERSVLILCLASFFLWLLSLSNGMIVQLNAGGVRRGPLYWAGQAPGYLALLLDAGYILYHRKSLGRWHSFWMFVFFLLPLLSSIQQQLLGGLFLNYVAIMFSFFLMYLLIQLDIQWKYLRQQEELDRQGFSQKVARLRPSLIYRSLDEIDALLEMDPEGARQAVSDFSDYLRSSMDAMQGKELRAFRQDFLAMQHSYRLWKLQYGDRLSLRYDIEEDAFYVPALTMAALLDICLERMLDDSASLFLTVTVSLEDTAYEILAIADFQGNVRRTDPREGFRYRGLKNALEKQVNGTVLYSFDPELGEQYRLLIPLSREGRELPR